MLLLALETSCDETAVAVLRSNGFACLLLTSEVASQIAEHEKYGGVVPEVASRNHLVQAPCLIERAIRNANIKLSDVDAFAATSGPGLATSLMIGASIAKGLAISFGKPYLAINHLEGHLLSPFFGQNELTPNVSLIVSGGHTLTVFVRSVGDYEIIGRTVDDAAGEAFDKVAKLLGLGYPGGPEIEKLARHGDPDRFNLPRTMPDSQNFSFSGLKTAIRYLLPKIGVTPNRAHGEGSHPKTMSRHIGTRDESITARSFGCAQDDKVLADVSASFQQAVVEVLVQKTIAAAKRMAVTLVTISGGVSCNQELRRQMAIACHKEKIDLKTAEPSLCTDNAAMVAFAAALRSKKGFASKVTEEIDPNLALVGSG